MNFRCLFGHQWLSNCEECSRCGAVRQNAHQWEVHPSKCEEKCSKCGEIRQIAHKYDTYSSRCEKCGVYNIENIIAQVEEYKHDIFSPYKTDSEIHCWEYGYDMPVATARGKARDWLLNQGLEAHYKVARAQLVYVYLARTIKTLALWYARSKDVVVTDNWQKDSVIKLMLAFTEDRNRFCLSTGKQAFIPSLSLKEIGLHMFRYSPGCSFSSDPEYQALLKPFIEDWDNRWNDAMQCVRYWHTRADDHRVWCSPTSTCSECLAQRSSVHPPIVRPDTFGELAIMCCYHNEIVTPEKNCSLHIFVEYTGLVNARWFDSYDLLR